MTSTNGGSVTGSGGACLAAGWPELPPILAERLHLLAGRYAVALDALPSGEVPVMGAGRWHRMPYADWLTYRALCASRDALLASLCAEGLAS